VIKQLLMFIILREKI